MSDRCRYAFKPTPQGDFLGTASFATRDTAVEWARKFSKKQAAVFVIDTHESPHRLICKAEFGHLRWISAACKGCAGKGWLKPSGDTCDKCDGIGGVLDPMPWRPN